MSIEDVYNQEKSSLDALASQYSSQIADQKSQAQGQIDDNVRAANAYSQDVAKQASNLEQAYVNGAIPQVSYSIVQKKDSPWPGYILMALVALMIFKKGK